MLGADFRSKVVRRPPTLERVGVAGQKLMGWPNELHLNQRSGTISAVVVMGLSLELYGGEAAYIALVLGAGNGDRMGVAARSAIHPRPDCVTRDSHAL